MCKVHFTEASNLRRHKRTKHLNHERGHKCQFCDKEFARSDSLMKHRVAVHKVKLAFDRKRENAFACDQCDKAFGLRLVPIFFCALIFSILSSFFLSLVSETFSLGDGYFLTLRI